MKRDEPTSVYLFYAAEDRLLYVGASMQPATRISQHRGKPWWYEAERVELRHFPSRDEALLAEAQLIRELHPKHNVADRVWTEDELRERLRLRRARLASLDERVRVREQKRKAA